MLGVVERGQLNCWSSLSNGALQFRIWDDELSVVYNVATGDTHLISSIDVELLQRLSKSPCTTETLAGELVGLFSEAKHAVVVEFLDATLLQLQTVGLVTVAPH